MRRSDQDAHIRERLTANRFDLILQGGLNQHDTRMPRRTTRTNSSPSRLELQNLAFGLLLLRTRLNWALGRVFTNSFSILLRRSWASRFIRGRCSHHGYYMNAYEMPIKAHEIWCCMVRIVVEVYDLYIHRKLK